MTHQEQSLKKLGLSDAEIREVLEADKRIDKGEKLFELTPEQEKVAKQARTTTAIEKKTVYKFSQRQRKPNETKSSLIEFLYNAISQNEEISNLEITNKERQLAFQVGDKRFELTLIQKRK